MKISLRKRIVTIPNPSICARYLLEHKTKIFGGHRWKNIIMSIIFTNNFPHHFSHKTSFFGMIISIWITTLFNNYLSVRAMSFCYADGNTLHIIQNQ